MWMWNVLVGKLVVSCALLFRSFMIFLFIFSFSFYFYFALRVFVSSSCRICVTFICPCVLMFKFWSIFSCAVVSIINIKYWFLCRCSIKTYSIRIYCCSLFSVRTFFFCHSLLFFFLIFCFVFVFCFIYSLIFVRCISSFFFRNSYHVACDSVCARLDSFFFFSLFIVVLHASINKWNVWIVVVILLILHIITWRHNRVNHFLLFAVFLPLNVIIEIYNLND